MTRTIAAVYEDGVLRPLEDPGLEEHQRVLLELRPASLDEPESDLSAWTRVYEGLSSEDLDTVEAAAFDRTRFLTNAR